MTRHGDRRVRLLVSGEVQGVGYRMACAGRARHLGLGGSVRNLPDGRVEVHAEGPPLAIDELITWCRLGPPMARVADVERIDERPTGERTFSVG